METYEESVSAQPYIKAYAIDRTGEMEAIVVLHVSHAARDWREGERPG